MSNPKSTLQSTSSSTSPPSHAGHIHTPLCRSRGAPAGAPTPVPRSGDSPPPAYRPISMPDINATTSTAAIALSPSPVPQALLVPRAAPPFAFQAPAKRIACPDDIAGFHASTQGRHFLGFVASLSASVHGRKLSDPLPSPPSAAVSAILDLISALSTFAASTPPSPHSSCYGNPAFRVWHGKLAESVNELIAPITSTAAPPSLLAGAEVELAPYLLDSFGNGSGIDYGPGHETNFAAFLYCLARLGLITEDDFPAVVLRVFAAYLDLMRTLQDTYLLEPAGSHAVRGLDDYHFLPFVFGAAQLIDHQHMNPKSIHDPDSLENFSEEYMYLSCIMRVKKVKKGPFAEHSPVLEYISGMPDWTKVNTGLLKMYKAEVLEKVPIMQHFLFGSLIKCTDEMEDVFQDYEGRRDGIILALSLGLDEVLKESKNVLINTPFPQRKCLWGFPDGKWKTLDAQYQAVEEIPQPQPLIPFDKQWDQWVSRMADLSDAWLISVVYYGSMHLGLNERKNLVEQIRRLPSLKTAINPECPLSLFELNEEPLQFQPEYLKMKAAPSLCMRRRCDFVGDGTDIDQWIQCNMCEIWYHCMCCELTLEKAEVIHFYHCANCLAKVCT